MESQPDQFTLLDKYRKDFFNYCIRFCVYAILIAVGTSIFRLDKVVILLSQISITACILCALICAYKVHTIGLILEKKEL